MAVLVVGGGGRESGKSAVACALIAALPELQWAAIKVSPHSHGLADGVWEEQDRGSEKDTGRYLRAGARRAFLMRSTDDATESVKQVRALAAECDAVLVESNRVRAESVAKPGEAVYSIAVLSGESSKASLQKMAGNLDALVLANLSDPASWVDLAAERVFVLGAGQWVTADLVHTIRTRFLSSTASSWI